MMFLDYIFQRSNNYIVSKIKETGAQYKAYGIFGLFNFPLYYLIWLYLSPQTYENLFLRTICTILCFLLVFHSKWPNKLKKFLPIYWYFTLLFTLPFFFTFMLIMNHGAAMWVTNTIVIVFFIVLLVDWISAIILLSIGSSIGILVASFFTPSFFHALFDYTGFFITYFVAIVIGIIFAHNKQVIEEVRRRSIKAEANSRAKSEFIANMSHDILTPITGMLGMVQDMLNMADQTKSSLQKEQASATASPKSSPLLTNIIETVERDGQFLIAATDELLQLCNEILEVVRLESGAPTERLESFNLHEIVQHNVELLQPYAKHKNLSLSYDISPATPNFLNGLRIYLDRILLNLISNALKFTEIGFVKVKVGLLENTNTSYQPGDKVTIQIVVEDTGIGIPEDKFDMIFEHFSRLTPSYEGVYKGSGLGLYTVNRYVGAMVGRIRVESKINKGTRFIVSLPFTVSDRTDRIRQSIRQSTPIKPTKSSTTVKKTTTDDLTASILLVEDNAAAMAVTLALKPFNCVIDIAEDGAQAVKKAESKLYDLIFMDVGLPDISGIDVTKAIRAFSDIQKSQVPIVVLTGHAGDVEKRQECIDAGIQEVLSKPVQPLALESVLQRFVLHTSAPVIIDWEGCVHMCQGDSEFTRHLLSMFSKELKATQDILAKAYADKDTKALLDELHRCRGGICYLKLPQLEYALKTFDHAVKADPQDLNELEATYTALQQAMEAFWVAWKLEA